MKSVNQFLILMLILGLGQSAFAQTPDPAAPPAEPTETEAAPEPQATLEPEATPDPEPPEPPALDAPPAADANPQSGPEALALYQGAFEDLAAGNRVEAKKKLKLLVQTYPNDPLAQNGAAVLLILVPAMSGPPQYEKASGLARAEFVTFQTLHGIALGAEFCVLVECNAQGTVGMLMLGAGAGLGASLVATQDGITDGHAQVLNSGVLWGAWHAGALAGMDVLEDKGVVVGLISFQLLGLGAGEIIHRTIEPTSGDVSLATSGGAWTGFFTGLVMGMADVDNAKAAFAGLLISSDIGLVGASFLAQRFPMSRGRVLVIDSGGILGALVGVGVPVLIESDNSKIIFGSTIMGTAAGLGLATYFSRNWDVEADPNDLQVDVGIAPTDGGGLVTAFGTF